MLGVYFSSSKYIVNEGEGCVVIEIYRLTQVNFTDSFHLKTENASSSAGKEIIIIIYLSL